MKFTRSGKARRVAIALIAAVGLVSALGACGGDDSDTATESTATGGAAESTAAGSGSENAAITVAGQWARTSPASAENGAAYMTLTASEDDALVKASADPSIAEMVQVHETVMSEGKPGSTMASGSETTAMGSRNNGSMMGAEGTGAMTMQQVDRLELPKGEAVELKPGGYHIMLMGLAAPLEKGSTIELTLTFEKAGEMKVSVPVQDAAP